MREGNKQDVNPTQKKDIFSLTYLALVAMLFVSAPVFFILDPLTPLSTFFIVSVNLAALSVLAGLRVVKQYERGVILTLGKYTGMRDPGLRFIVPVLQKFLRVDIRVKVVDVPNQDCITKDNVSINVSAVLYYRISSADRAVLEVEDFQRSVSELAQTTMRDIVGEHTLDSLLTGREEISNRIREIVDAATDQWGVYVQMVELKHVELPSDMQRTMGKEAEAERERRAVIIKAEGERRAAENLAVAARTLSESPGALHLRTLHSLNDLSSDQSNTVVFTVPIEVLRALENIGGRKSGATGNR